MAEATNGNVGSATHSKEQIAEIRHQEALASTELIGAKLIWLSFPDEFLFDNEESRLKFVETLGRHSQTLSSVTLQTTTTPTT